MGFSDAAPAIRAVLFDYGGVLTTPTRHSIQDWTAREHIRPETFSAALKEWLSRNAPAGTPIHRLETGEITVEEFNDLLAERLRTVDDGPVAADGLLQRIFAKVDSEPAMLDLVRRLREGGTRTALLSNSWDNDYPWDLLDGLFETTVISGEVGLRKPDPRIFRLTLDRLGIAAHEAVFVDDGEPNIEAAEQLGFHAVLHTGVASTRARLTELVPTLDKEH